jgi:hypothetical protein
MYGELFGMRANSDGNDSALMAPAKLLEMYMVDIAACWRKSVGWCWCFILSREMNKQGKLLTHRWLRATDLSLDLRYL